MDVTIVKKVSDLPSFTIPNYCPQCGIQKATDPASSFKWVVVDGEAHGFCSARCRKAFIGGLDDNQELEYKIAGEGYVATPFDIEAILSACPNLYRKWKEHPFFFNIDGNGRVCVVYLTANVRR